MLAEQRMKERTTEQEDGTDEVPLMDNNERPRGVSREAQRTKGTLKLYQNVIYSQPSSG